MPAPMDWKIELVPIPLSDVDAAKRFYTEKLGFSVDHDVSTSRRVGTGIFFFFFNDPDGNSWAVQRIAPEARRPQGDQS
jgi:catechol 2,3-dioxygenase-like lactoylglutathione lyase family enzyme